MIYIAGPIDYLGKEPEQRHLRVGAILSEIDLRMEVWCPACRYDPGLSADANIDSNMAALAAAQVLIVEWDAPAQPSFGTPIEIWARRGVPGTLVVGDLGRGLFARALEPEVTVLSGWENVGAYLRAWKRPET